jgi:hypothetical protein
MGRILTCLQYSETIYPGIDMNQIIDSITWYAFLIYSNIIHPIKTTAIIIKKIYRTASSIIRTSSISSYGGIIFIINGKYFW